MREAFVARPVWWIAAAFLAVQAGIIGFAANGPFVDEGLYVTAGLRVLEGQGPADGYLAWFNGSPYLWPVAAALGHRLAGLAGARLVAAVLCTVTLVAFAETARQLFGRPSAIWSALAFAVNGLFLALAHFAVYDVAALAGLAVSMWCATRAPGSPGWTIAAGVAAAAAVIAKYGYAPMIMPIAALLVSTREIGHRGRAPLLFLSTVGSVVTAYFWLSFGTLVPTSSAAYLGQTFGRTRGHIAVLQVVFGGVPVALTSIGAIVAWRRHSRLAAVTCLLATAVFPAFHLWTANFISGQKHVVAGFLFAYLLAGVALEWMWKSGSRPLTAALLALVTLWGAAQCHWQDRSWADVRPLARHLVMNMEPGEQIVAESSWSYTVYLYSAGKVTSPADVIDANHSPGLDRRDICRIPWLAGNPASAEPIRRAITHCGHQDVISSTARHYYIDTERFRLASHPAVVSVYRLPTTGSTK